MIKTVTKARRKHRLRSIISAIVILIAFAIYGTVLIRYEQERTTTSNLHMLQIYAMYTTQLLDDVYDMLYRVGYIYDTTDAQRTKLLQKIWEGRQRDDPLVHSFAYVDKHKRVNHISIDTKGVEDITAGILLPDKPETKAVGRPFVSRVDGRWIFPITYAFGDGNGGIAGYATIMIDIDEIEKRYASLRSGSENIVSLFSANGELMARIPPQPTLRGQVAPIFSVLSMPIPNRIYTNEILVSIDHSKQLVSFAPLEKYGMIVSSAMGYSSIVSHIFSIFGGLFASWFLLSIVSYYLSKRTFRDELKVYETNMETRLALQSEVEDALIKRIEADKERRKQEKLLIQQSKMAAMGEMIGAIAHQWRQPLNSIGLYVQDLRDAYKFGELTESYINNTIENTMTQLKFMSSTIDDFRNFFKPDKQRTEFDLAKIVNDTLKIISDQLSNHDIRTVFEIPDEPLWCFGYENELGQAIMNIVINAKDALIEYSAMRDKTIVIRLKKDGKDAVLEIEDNGGGIANMYMERIFEPYFTTKDQSKATGIGLYMTKMIVEDNMNGKVSASNTKEGAIFTIRLPIVYEGAKRDSDDV
jgi:signal transduction histidine kinase